MKYLFKTQPFTHQKEVLTRCWKMKCFAFFWEMGTGKSKACTDNAGILYLQDAINGMVVIAPKGVYQNWIREIKTHLSDQIDYNLIVWKSKKSREVLDNLESAFKSRKFNILLVNVDIVNTDRGYGYVKKFTKAHKTYMVVDESTIIKNFKAKRTKNTIALGGSAQFKRILTGSPVTKNPEDLYSQCAFLGLGFLGHSSFYSFRNTYCKTIEIPLKFDEETGKVIKKFTKVTGYKNLDKLKEKLERFSDRKTKDECLDLPPKVYITRDVELTEEQRKAYNQMRDLCITEFELGLVTVTTALTQLLRLHQIVCGYVPTDMGEMVSIPNNRMEILAECLDEIDSKVIIWSKFRQDIKAITSYLKKTYGEDSTVHYYGDTTDEERLLAVEEFQNPASPVRYFVGNPQTGGYGLTLTQAKYVIYYSNSFNLEERLQSEDRAHRIGQDTKVTYIDLMCRGTIDEKIIKALRDKIDIATEILGDKYKQWVI